MRRIGSDEEDSQGDDDRDRLGDIIVGTQWEAVGPFPSGMREHPMMGSPLAAFLPRTEYQDPDVDFARRPYDPDETWPSELSFGGRVGWSRFTTEETGWVEISYPHIRWDQLRNDHGWSALQFQSILRTSFTLPKLPGKEVTPFRIDLVQGTEFALIPADRDPELPIRWYAGDVYAFADTPSGFSGTETKTTTTTSNFARSLALPPGEYTMLVRAMYEIRMFGDPGLGNAPVIRMSVRVEMDGSDVLEEGVQVLDGSGVVPDVVDGWLMGEWMSVGVRASAGLEADARVSFAEKIEEGALELELRGGDVRLVPGQTRPLAIRIKQLEQLGRDIKWLRIPLRVQSGRKIVEKTWTIPLRHHDPVNLSTFKMTFASPALSIPLPPGASPALVSYAMVVPPPALTYAGVRPPVILAAHGAGVDASSPFWTAAMPVRPGGWAVCPTGRNEWGEDWHGGSMADAWAARDALPWVAERLGCEVSDQTLLVGHSNGGQGAWHLAARYPDRVVGVIAASGWLKIQDYVPYTQSTSGHFSDPALLGILHSSLTPYNNDLYASNLAHIPILAVHGSDDDNVPPRHSRAHVALVSAWGGDQGSNSNSAAGTSSSSIELVEVLKKGHWWDDVFREKEVVEWLDGLSEKEGWDEQRKRGFTLTSANPQECGGRAGIRILELETPGRLARLDVNARQWRDRANGPLDLRGMNIRRISVDTTGHGATVLKRGVVEWEEEMSSAYARAYGPMIRLLSTSAALTLVAGMDPSSRSIAQRIAHDLYVYHRLDSEILEPHDALERTARGLVRGNVVVIGGPKENRYTEWLIAKKRIPLSFPTKGVMTVGGKLVYESGAGIITLHPHPTSLYGLAAIIAGNDPEGLELAARLFPLRTGVPIPDWAVVGRQSRWRGAGGFIGAGFWDAEWKWSEAMSWMDR